VSAATRSLIGAVVLLISVTAHAGERCVAIDGDSLRCGRERVRIEGVYAPDVDKPRGPQARQRLQQRIQSGEVVIERRGRDRYGRTLGRLYINGNRITQIDLNPKSSRGTN
jgi:micrococcal nuclease